MDNQMVLAQQSEYYKLTMVLDCVANARLSLVPFAEGTNAICTALADIKWFSEFVFPIEGRLPNPVEMRVTAVNANIRQMNPSGQCNFTVEIKFDHSYTSKEILKVIKNHTWCKFKIRDEGVNYEVVEDAVYSNPVLSNNY